jgi:hypothetical protein
MRRILLTAFAASLLSGCGPKCLKGHYESVDMPGHFETMYIKSGPVMVPISTWHPPSKQQAWVCDQYEVEKGSATKK